MNDGEGRALLPVEYRLTGRPASVGEAQQALGRLLDGRFPSCSASARADTLLVVSQLIDAAQQHGIDVAGVTARVGDDLIDLHVEYEPQTDVQVESALTDGWAWTNAASLADKLSITQSSAEGLKVRLLVRLQ
ncbi:hypothetical protein [Streptomyces sp. NPDC002564]|uniref:hypothetical protein n=1 Tax=Streptomyces sp. NPDC002564 TaxID=3364649 RepID=UPI0036912134